MSAPCLRVPPAGRSRRVPACLGALLAVLMCVGTAGPAAAQSPGLQLQATPSPFQPNASIAINAEVWMNGLVESFCSTSWWPPCVVLSVYTSAQVTRPGGFSAFTDTWDDWVTLQTSDPGPGQSMQSTTYTLTGMVVVTYCDWDIFLGDCHTEAAAVRRVGADAGDRASRDLPLSR